MADSAAAALEVASNPMRKLLPFYLLLLLTAHTFAQENAPCSRVWSRVTIDSTPQNNTNSYNWMLLYEETFDNASLDTDVWYTCPNGWQRHHGHELQYYLDENILIKDGILHLTAKQETGTYEIRDYDASGKALTNTRRFDYSSAWIQTRDKYQYGKFEVRCKVPKGRGFWPAFWFFGSHNEIDVFEFRGDQPRRPQLNIHYWCTQKTRIDSSSTPRKRIDYSKDFHTYSLEWDDCKIVFRIDDDIVRTDYKYKTENGELVTNKQQLATGNYWQNPLFPDEEVSLILNLAISQERGGIRRAHAPNDNTLFPASFEIDYVKIYQRVQMK